MVVENDLTNDALAISEAWRQDLDVLRLTRDRLTESGLVGVRLDVVAIGKASLEMAGAVHAVAGVQVARTLVVTDVARPSASMPAAEVVVGEHPRPGTGSQRAGEALVDFLDGDADADATLFLLSGGASSLCVYPMAPATVADLGALFDAALVSGVDITTLNRLRASASAIAGGAVLRHVRTPSASFILVDNVISGAPWVASGLTYEYRPSREETVRLLESVGLRESATGERLLDSVARRDEVMTAASGPHENLVFAEPSMMLVPTLAEAARRGYRVVDMGAAIQGEVGAVREEWRSVMRLAAEQGGAVAVVGVGEVTVEVRGAGRGGRCQEFAWSMAPVLAELGRTSAFLARASDGRDYLEGVAGAWVDDATMALLARRELDWDNVAAANDTFPALEALGQLISGGRTGWNLCDLYLGLIAHGDPSPAVKD